MYDTELNPRQALIQCGGDHLRSECAEFPWAAWQNAQEKGFCVQNYWAWVCDQATMAGLSLSSLHQSEQSKQYQADAAELRKLYHFN